MCTPTWAPKPPEGSGFLPGSHSLSLSVCYGLIHSVFSLNFTQLLLQTNEKQKEKHSCLKNIVLNSGGKPVFQQKVKLHRHVIKAILIFKPKCAKVFLFFIKEHKGLLDIIPYLYSIMELHLTHGSIPLSLSSVLQSPFVFRQCQFYIGKCL